MLKNVTDTTYTFTFGAFTSVHFTDFDAALDAANETARINGCPPERLLNPADTFKPRAETTFEHKPRIAWNDHTIKISAHPAQVMAFNFDKRYPALAVAVFDAKAEQIMVTVRESGVPELIPHIDAVYWFSVRGESLYSAALKAIADAHENFNRRYRTNRGYLLSDLPKIVEAQEKHIRLEYRGLQAARNRGHRRIKRVSVTVPTRNNGFRATSICICPDCGKQLSVDTNPPPNGIDLSGGALALGCDKNES